MDNNKEETGYSAVMALRNEYGDDPIFGKAYNLLCVEKKEVTGSTITKSEILKKAEEIRKESEKKEKKEHHILTPQEFADAEYRGAKFITPDGEIGSVYGAVGILGDVRLITQGGKIIETNVKDLDIYNGTEGSKKISITDATKNALANNSTTNKEVTAADNIEKSPNDDVKYRK